MHLAKLSDGSGGVEAFRYGSEVVDSLVRAHHTESTEGLEGVGAAGTEWSGVGFVVSGSSFGGHR